MSISPLSPPPATGAVTVVGHLARDVIHLADGEVTTCGGTAFYAGSAYARLGLFPTVVTKLAEADREDLVEPLTRVGCRVHVRPSRSTTRFENSPSADLRTRSQRVLSVADPFSTSDLPDPPLGVVHLGPLTRREMDVAFVEAVARRASFVVLDVQGFVRRLDGGQVALDTWSEAARVLSLCDVAKADGDEAFVITGERDPAAAASALLGLGAREALVTLADGGSVVAAGSTVSFIPSMSPRVAVDSTGAGDTYAAAYVYGRFSGDDPDRAARFATAAASLSIEATGPFSGTRGDIEKRLATKR